MAYDLNFWRYELEATPHAPGQADTDHLSVYQRLCNEDIEVLAELEVLPVEAIQRRLSAVLGKAWLVDGDPLRDETVSWVRRSDQAAAIDEFVTPKWVRFDLRGKWTGNDANVLIDVMHEFGLPLFDPQVGEHGERFDAPASRS